MEEVLFSEIAGFSMWPLLRPADKLMVKRVPIEELKRGDIILYRSGKNLVCHRLLSKAMREGKQMLYLRGDCSLSLGEFVSPEAFFGKAVAIVRKDKLKSLLGRKQRFINWVLMLVSPLFSLAIKIAAELKIRLRVQKNIDATGE